MSFAANCLLYGLLWYLCLVLSFGCFVSAIEIVWRAWRARRLHEALIHRILMPVNPRRKA